MEYLVATIAILFLLGLMSCRFFDTWWADLYVGLSGILIAACALFSDTVGVPQTDSSYNPIVYVLRLLGEPISSLILLLIGVFFVYTSIVKYRKAAANQ